MYRIPKNHSSSGTVLCNKATPVNIYCMNNFQLLSTKMYSIRRTEWQYLLFRAVSDNLKRKARMVIYDIVT